VIPALVLGLAEACVRRTADRLPLWYGAADALAAQDRVDALFVGSSRVEAAVVPETFEAVVLARTGRPLRTLNMGRGRSTDFEHYLGLRNLLERHPTAFSGLRVFWEAPGGVPVAGRYGIDPWATTEQPWLLVDLLDVSDLEALWRSSALDVGTRLHLSLRLWLRPIRLFNRRERLRQSLLSLPSLLAMGRLAELFGSAPLGSDLRAHGRLYDNALRVLEAREGALEFASGVPNALAAWRSGQPTGVSLAVDLVRAHGGQVIFFRPPEAEVFEQAYVAPAWLEERRAFEARADAWGCPRLSPAFPHADDDLPDLWHLRPARAPEFTRALADAWLDHAGADARRP
jgi:hypothetical protein